MESTELLTEETLEEETETSDEMPDEAADPDEEAENAEAERKLSRFSRGCLEVAGAFAGLAAVLLLFEQIGICFAYELPQLCLPLTLAAGSLLALTVSLFSAFRKGLASFVLIITIWFLIIVYAVYIYVVQSGINHPTLFTELHDCIISDLYLLGLFKSHLS